MDGFFVIDKPMGLTSHDVVAVVRKILKQKKVGHTGTLDPFATGVLPLAVGEATKAITFLDESVKHYRAVMRLGIATDTLDRTGKILRHGDFKNVSMERILETFTRFTGKISQVPPMFSAVKHGGVPLYKLARRGEEVERAPRDIQILKISLEAFEPPLVSFTVMCSRGTYVRVLAGDIGDKLGCYAHLTDLKRLCSGPFSADKALSLDELRSLQEEGRSGEVSISTLEALSHLKMIELTETGAMKVAHGVSPGKADLADQRNDTFTPGEKFRLAFKDKLSAIAVSNLPNGVSGAKTIRLLRVFA